jgi:hypothetical protein
MTNEAAQLRQTLSSQLIAALAADFASDGPDAVKRLREKDPSAYLRAVTAVTADVPSTEATWSELTDDELVAALADVRNARSAGEGIAGGARSAAECEQTCPLSPVPETEAVP